MKKIIILIILTNILFSCDFCYASNVYVYVYDEQYRIFEIDNLLNEVPDSASDIEFGEITDLNTCLAVFFEKIRENFVKIFTGGLRTVFAIIAVSIVCGSISGMASSTNTKIVKITSSLVGALTVLAVSSDKISGIIGVGSSFINEIGVFSKTLLPTVAATEAACGLTGSAVVRANIALLFSDILLYMIKNILLPLTYINIFAATANVATEINTLKKLCDFSSKTVAFLLKTFLGIYISYISVAGIVASGADQSGVKVVKLAVGGVVPIVGPVIAKSAEVVLSGALMMKNFVGVFGLLVVLSAFVTPFLTLLINYFLFKTASIFASPAIGVNIAELTERLSGSFGLILGMCATAATVIFVAIISAMRSVAF